MKEQVWEFKTARFRVVLSIEPSDTEYDGDDDGETQAGIASGLYQHFDSMVRVYLDGEEVGYDCLGSSVYEHPSEFWRAHWDSPANGRNTLAIKAANCCIGHYFPDMVREACRMARERVKALQSVKLREAA